MQLRNLSIPTGAVFAPMAGLTDAACRHLMADHGAAWTVSEMASAKALNFHDEKSLALLRDKQPPRPVRHPAVRRGAGVNGQGNSVCKGAGHPI